jgi:hypothetical protein
MTGTSTPAEAREQGAHVRQDVFAVVSRVEGADPGVEDLQGLRPRLGLGAQVVTRDLGEQRGQAVPGLGVGVHQRLREREVRRMAAFDRVRSQRERSAREADERDLALQLAPQHPDRVQHHAEVLARLEPPQGLDVRARPQRLLDHRTFAGLEVERDAEGGEGQQEIGEEDGRIHAEGVDGLQRDLHRQLRRAAEGEQRVLRAQAPVLGHVTAGLPHEPDGRAVDLLEAAGAEEAVVHSRIIASARLHTGTAAVMRRARTTKRSPTAKP